jgi:hypothetical protein
MLGQFSSMLFVLSMFLLSSEVRPSEIALSQETHCDPELNEPNNDPHGYHLRGVSRDRCEGIYMRG